jgi:AAA15 family ATPase/GTPase
MAEPAIRLRASRSPSAVHLERGGEIFPASPPENAFFVDFLHISKTEVWKVCFMLIKFAVENLLSIRSRQELSMVAASLKDPGVDLVDAGEVQLLPATIMYGANASGKSNLLLALSFLSGAVESSHADTKPNAKIPRTPFLLDDESGSAPTKVDVDFYLNGVRFHFGFVATSEAFVEEWLYAFPSGKRQTWYYRDQTKQSIYFGKNLRGSLKTIEGLTRPNSLFLSAAAQNAHKQLTSIYEYLSGLSFLLRVENEALSAGAAFSDGKIDERIINFLQEADTGIVGYRFDDLVKEGSQSKAFLNDLISLFKKHAPEGRDLPQEIERADMKRLLLAHRATSKKPRYFDLRVESAGTLRLLTLLRSVFEAIDSGGLVVIDELDASLHTYLAEKIVALFNSSATNPHGAQLIATTQDTNLLRTGLVRRDQVWFVEKDKLGASNLYPLTDIRTRVTDNLEKGYLQGRFGAVPFRAPINFFDG